MRVIFTILFFFICTSLSAINKYVDSTGGSLSGNGNSPSTAYKSIAQVNAIFVSLGAGDSIFFKRGEVWHDRLKVTKNGVSGNPIFIGAYGTGAKPLFSGFTDVTGWSNIGGNIWQSSPIIGSNQRIRMVTKNGVAKAVGRWPNTTWRTVTSSTPATSSTDATLPASPNWTGGRYAGKKLHDVISSDTITNHTGNTITYGGNLTGYGTINGWGYIITDHPSTLDVQDEWYFNPSGRRMNMYSVGVPTNIRMSYIDTLIFIGNHSFIQVDNIAFEGGNIVGVCWGTPGSMSAGPGNGNIVQNCSFDNMGRDGIYATWNTLSKIDNNNFNHCLNNGILLDNEGGYSITATVTNNTLKNIGYLEGMGWWEKPFKGYNTSLNGITIIGTGATVQNNFLDTIGHVGIAMYYRDCAAINNFVNYHNFVTDDGGGINFFDIASLSSPATEANIRVIGNIVINGIGNQTGKAPASTERIAVGIYFDDKIDHILAQGNSCARNTRAGYYNHNATEMVVRDNTFYDNGIIVSTGEASVLFSHDNHAVSLPIRNIDFKNNIMFSVNPTQLVFSIRTYSGFSNIDSMFTSIDSNIYARPINPTGVTFKQRWNFYPGGPLNEINGTFTQWKTAHTGAWHGAYDVHSTEMALNTNTSTFHYNASDTVKVIRFIGLRKTDPRLNIYDNIATIPRWGSLILLDAGSAPVTNQPPIADAGINKVITLPVANSSASGSGSSDVDGTIAGYSWVQILGPNTATLGGAGTVSLTMSGLIQGVYKFELTVTDDDGATGKDTMQVTVNAAINTPPTSIPGANFSIQLPVTSTTLNGSGTDAEGPIAGYLWEFVTGPVTPTIVSPASASTAINGLTVQGDYTFSLTVTDGGGLTDTKVITVTVLPAIPPVNNPPVSIPGANQTITLPDDDVTVMGTGTDTDGTITGYLWTQAGGPAIATIVSPTSATTDIEGLLEGTYIFNLQVTDDDGATDTKPIVITVNAAPPNVPPIVSAGGDQTIILPTDYVTLTATASDADGTITTYSWVMITGVTSTIEDPSFATTNVTGLLQGVYEFEITVTDNNGGTAKDTVMITVMQEPIQNPPVANAGANQVILYPNNSVTLVGSGTDIDGTIVGYVWKEGATTVGTTQTITLNNVTVGTHYYTLTVTDNDGLTGSDTVEVIINPAPNYPYWLRWYEIIAP